MQFQVRQSLAPRVQEEADLRVAEAVNGLHRVADREHRAPVSRLPSRGEALEQLPLRVGGVLELVHQQVAHARVHREQQVGRLLGRAERA